MEENLSPFRPFSVQNDNSAKTGIGNPNVLFCSLETNLSIRTNINMRLVKCAHGANHGFDILRARRFTGGVHGQLSQPDIHGIHGNMGVGDIAQRGTPRQYPSDWQNTERARPPYRRYL